VRTPILVAALAMIGLLFVLMVIDIARSGIQALTLVSLLVLALFGFGIVGALRDAPPDE
jgi:hypothetical protein